MEWHEIFDSWGYPWSDYLTEIFPGRLDHHTGMWVNDSEMLSLQQHHSWQCYELSRAQEEIDNSSWLI